MSYKYVEVEWLDIISTAGWEKSEETKMPVFWSYGYLINHDDEEVRIATTKDEDNEWFGITVIPNGCVKKITPLVTGGLIKDFKETT
tara:strand:+ start:3457 stop:3717 length:261 start_codon:yes stop_codon:yes gene_type:complete